MGVCLSDTSGVLIESLFLICINYFALHHVVCLPGQSLDLDLTSNTDLNLKFLQVIVGS
jgi:hypothetical protein